VSSTFMNAYSTRDVFNACQCGGYEDKFEDKKRPSENAADAEILQGLSSMSSSLSRSHSHIPRATAFLTIS